jgi:DNA-binding transcriptional LysR family regulator
MPHNNIKRLKAFVAVAESGSVTEAANRLALTQSGVSRQIAAMEEEVGFALFDRVRGRLSVSQKGAMRGALWMLLKTFLARHWQSPQEPKTGWLLQGQVP